MFINRIVSLLIIAILLHIPAHAKDLKKGRFKYEGDGHIALKNNKSGQKLDLNYRDSNGNYPKEAIKKLNHFFGIHRQKFGENVSLRLIAMLDYLQDKYSPQQRLNILSAYRSPKYNESLRRRGRKAAKTSYHLEGMAADVIFPKANHKKIWEETRALNCCGVGHYGGASVHVDSGKPRFWTQKTAVPKGKKGQKPSPQENKNIYLSHEKDIYLDNEEVRFFLSGISHYPFGIKPKAKLLRSKNSRKIIELEPQFTYAKKSKKSSCVMIHERKEARHINWKIPKKKKWPKEDLFLEIEFCNHSFEKMPQRITSRSFKIVKDK